jgi:hypothetical protein
MIAIEPNASFTLPLAMENHPLQVSLRQVFDGTRGIFHQNRGRQNVGVQRSEFLIAAKHPFPCLPNTFRFQLFAKAGNLKKK